MKIQWTAPFDNYLAISQYRVWLKESTGSFVEKLELCDGSDMTAMTEQFCIVPMYEFWDADMNYVAGSTVFAKISAINERGESVISLANSVGAAV